MDCYQFFTISQFVVSLLFRKSFEIKKKNPKYCSKTFLTSTVQKNICRYLIAFTKTKKNKIKVLAHQPKSYKTLILKRQVNSRTKYNFSNSLQPSCNSLPLQSDFAHYNFITAQKISNKR